MKKIFIFLLSVFVFTGCIASEAVELKDGDDEKAFVIDATNGPVTIHDTTFDSYQKLLKIVEKNDKISYKDGKVIIKADASLWFIGLMVVGVAMFGGGGVFALRNTSRGKALHDKISIAVLGVLGVLLAGGASVALVDLLKKRFGNSTLVELDHNGIYFKGTAVGVKGTYLTWKQVREVVLSYDRGTEYVVIMPSQTELLTKHQFSLVRFLAFLGSCVSAEGASKYFGIHTDSLPIATPEFLMLVDHFKGKDSMILNN